MPAAQDLVLAARPLRPGVVLADTSRFGEDVWRLEPAVLQRHVASLTLSFSTVPVRYRLHAKQLCYAMLSGSLPAGEKRHSPVGIHGALAALRRFLHWLDTRPAAPGRPERPALAELTPQDLDDYNRHLLTIRHVGTRQNAQRAVRLLWRYRRGLTDPLPMDPHQADGWVGAHRPRENTTDRIPEPVLAALISWAVRFVDEFAPDILAADAWSQDYRSRLVNDRRGRTTGAREDLQSYLDRHVRSGRPLPGVQGKPNTRFISVAAGMNATSLNTRPDLRALIHTAAAQVGATDHTWLPIPIGGVVDGQGWITGIAQQHPTQSLNILRRMLHIACYTVIAFLSGMRDGEIKHLHRGCLTTHRDPDGQPYRWKVASRSFKGEKDPAGTPATWIIGHPAARAVEVLERLQPAEQSLLFAHLPHASGNSARTNEVQTTKCTNKQLADFVAWINTYCAEHDRTDGVPAVNGRSWPLSSRQFRRTLAWFIARRPGGSIAGAIQYRHLSVHMFEGYANPQKLHQTGEKALVA